MSYFAGATMKENQSNITCGMYFNETEITDLFFRDFCESIPQLA